MVDSKTGMIIFIKDTKKLGFGFKNDLNIFKSQTFILTTTCLFLILILVNRMYMNFLSSEYSVVILQINFECQIPEFKRVQTIPLIVMIRKEL